MPRTASRSLHPCDGEPISFALWAAAPRLCNQGVGLELSKISLTSDTLQVTEVNDRTETVPQKTL